jgi:ribosome-associated translation inhibitor RaiA
MQLSITARRVPLTEACRRHIERRFDFALARLWPTVQSASVRIKDINGPRGGKDKVCTADVRLRGVGTIRIEQVDADLTAAIDRAADRVATTARRRMRQRRRRFRADKAA